MVLSVASFKGGVAKTTTAIHLAAFLSESAPTLLVDEDPNQSSVDWAEAGQLPFRTVTHDQAAAAFPQYQHRVVDTGARLGQEGLTDLSEGSDFVVVPTTPDALALNALLKTVTPLRVLTRENYRILLTLVPPFPSRDADEAREALKGIGLPLFKAQIPRAVAFQKAALAGTTVDAVRDPRAMLGWLAYSAVGREILGG